MTSTSRFILYSNEMVGLGHLRRSLAIAGRLSAVDPGATSLILTGSLVEPFFRLPPRVDTVKLPGRSRDVAGVERPSRLALGMDDLAALRSTIALAAARAFRPDVAVVDKLPLGLGGELAPALEELREDGRCRLVLGLRDIEDSAFNVRRKWGADTRDEIERLYDAVIVYGPPDTPDAIDALGWEKLSIPVFHVGYVGAPVPEERRRNAGPGFLLATAGGGSDGFPMLAAVAAAIRLRPLPCPTVMITGPLMDPAERGRLARLVDGLDVELAEFRTDLEQLVAEARGVVSMAGYNTVAEIMRARTPALLVPRVRPSQEQLLRAEALAGAGLQDMLHPDGLSPAAMREAIARLLTRGRLPALPRHYRGTERAVRILRTLASGRRATPSGVRAARAQAL